MALPKFPRIHIAGHRPAVLGCGEERNDELEFRRSGIDREGAFKYSQLPESHLSGKDGVDLNDASGEAEFVPGLDLTGGVVFVLAGEGAGLFVLRMGLGWGWGEMANDVRRKNRYGTVTVTA